MVQKLRVVDFASIAAIKRTVRMIKPSRHDTEVLANEPPEQDQDHTPVVAEDHGIQEQREVAGHERSSPLTGFLPYPLIDLHSARELFDKLGLADSWNEPRFRTVLDKYRRVQRPTYLFLDVMRVFTAASMAIVALLLTLWVIVEWRLSIAVIPWVAAGGIYFGTYWVTRGVSLSMWWQAFMARPRCLRTCKLLVDELVDRRTRRVSKASASWVVNRMGLAARELFVTVQESRLTWTAPPATSERAARLAYPLLNIELPDDFNDEMASADYRRRLAAFVTDVTCAVVINRPDLVPRVRAFYGDVLPTRADTASDADMRYLDPMRARTRWDVLKDPILPLAAIAISLVALVRK
jgi:hypothetical protein